jgi:hypothetical protein
MVVVLAVVTMPTTPAYALNCTWTGTTNTAWATASNWSGCGGGVPGAADDITIPNVTNDPVISAANVTVASISINNGGILTVNSTTDRTITVSGNVIINAGGTFQVANTLGANTHTLNVGGDFTNSGTFTTLATNDTINVTLNGGAAQTMGGTSTTTFQNLTLSPTAAATISANTNFNVAGTMTVNANATFSPAAGVQINSGGGQGTITGAGTINVTRVDTSDALDGQYNFSTKTLTNLTVDFAAAGNQEIDALIYGALRTSGSGTKTLGGNVTVNGNLTIGSGTTLDVGANNITVTGPTSISGTLTHSSATGTKQYTGLVTINSGGVWNNSGNSAINFRSGLTHNGATFTAGSGVYTFNTNAQAIGGASSISIPSVTVTGITLTNNGTLTVGTALAGSGGLTNSAAGTLNINFTGAVGITTLTASAAGNTVNYGAAGAQTVRAIAYSNLIFSGSGAKTVATGTSVTGNLSIAPTGTATASINTGLNIPVGSLTLGGLGRSSGTWGSTSSAATNQNNTYFAATNGIVTVSTDTRATPTVTTWPTASGITYGQALSDSTLTGGAASVSGSFAFTAPSTVPPAGTYSASVTFTPTDLTSYTTVVDNVVQSPQPS